MPHGSCSPKLPLVIVVQLVRCSSSENIVIQCPSSGYQAGADSCCLFSTTFAAALLQSRPCHRCPAPALLLSCRADSCCHSCSTPCAPHLSSKAASCHRCPSRVPPISSNVWTLLYISRSVLTSSVSVIIRSATFGVDICKPGTSSTDVCFHLSFRFVD